jgi:hypothetical protein
VSEAGIVSPALSTMICAVPAIPPELLIERVSVAAVI